MIICENHGQRREDRYCYGCALEKSQADVYKLRAYIEDMQTSLELNTLLAQKYCAECLMSIDLMTPTDEARLLLLIDRLNFEEGKETVYSYIDKIKEANYGKQTAKTRKRN